MSEPILRLSSLGVAAGPRPILRDISFDIPAGSIFGLIGPSGAGKSTLLKCCNRLVDLTPGLQVTGSLLFHGQPVFGPGTDPDALRARIGILFQQPAVFPGSILANVLFGARRLGRIPKRDLPGIAEHALQEAALWDEVKDRLNLPAARLSIGQQQRLCLARTLATDPEVVLMDEPTSALDPQATAAIENLILRLRGRRTIVIVTHNLAQARRVCSQVARLALVESIGTLAGLGPPTIVAAGPDDTESAG
jgi:phosphate transport system ATP-binding protein